MLTDREPGEARLALVGFMGSGKSAVGRALARRLGWPLHDSDARIEAVAGRAVRQIFADDGEAAFRALEHRTVADLLAGPGPFVLALGGGAAMHPATRDLLAERAVVVHLRVPLALALARVGRDPRRPMLTHPDLPGLHAERTAAHDDLAHLVVDVDAADVSGIVDDVIRRLADGPAEKPGERPGEGRDAASDDPLVATAGHGTPRTEDR